MKCFYFIFLFYLSTTLDFQPLAQFVMQPCHYEGRTRNLKTNSVYLSKNTTEKQWLTTPKFAPPCRKFSYSSSMFAESEFIAYEGHTSMVKPKIKNCPALLLNGSFSSTNRKRNFVKHLHNRRFWGHLWFKKFEYMCVWARDDKIFFT